MRALVLLCVISLGLGRQISVGNAESGQWCLSPNDDSGIRESGPA